MPQDLYAVQELIWAVRPDLVIETGIAHGGSLILSASMLALLDYCDAMESGAPLDVRAAPRRVLGIDIDDQHDTLVHGHSQRLCSTHSAAATSQRQCPGQRATKVLPRHSTKGFVGALEDALGANVNP